MQQAVVSLRLQSLPFAPLENGEARGNPRSSRSTRVRVKEHVLLNTCVDPRGAKGFQGSKVFVFWVGLMKGSLCKVSFLVKEADPLGFFPVETSLEGWRKEGAFFSTALKHHFFNCYLVWVLCIHVNPTLVDVRDLLLAFTEWHYEFQGFWAGVIRDICTISTGAEKCQISKASECPQK